MRKKFLAIFLTLCLVLPCLSATAFLADQPEPTSGNCGTGLTWSLQQNNSGQSDGNPTYTLTIRGNGAMENYMGLDEQAAPWVRYSYKNQITEAKIENGVTLIGECAFYSCRGLTRVDIPSQIVSIGESAFASCENLTDVNLSNGLQSIGQSAFFQCKKLANITIPNSVTSIGVAAFSETGLTNIQIPNSVNSIGRSAFSKTNLASITIPNSINSINSNMFQGCSNLTSVFIPISVTSILANAFQDCNSLTSITYAGSEAEWNAIYKSNDQDLQHIKIICKDSEINPSTPDNPSIPDNPSTPDNPSIPDNPNTPSNPSAPSDPSTPSTPGSLAYSIRDGSLGKRLTIRADIGHFLTIQTEKGDSVTITSIQVVGDPNTNGDQTTAPVTFSVPVGTTIQIWETENEMTFANKIPTNPVLRTLRQTV